MGVNFINKYQNLVISKSGKNHNKIVNLKVENFEQLGANTRVYFMFEKF